MRSNKFFSGMATILMVLGGLRSGMCDTEPNYVRTTVYQYDKDGNALPSIVSTQYSDGLGRAIESQVKQNTTGKTLVSATTYDDAGRPEKTFKTVAMPNVTGFKPISDVEAAANALPGAGGHGYSQVRYYDDPLGRLKETGAPGTVYSLDDVHHSKQWYFGTPGTGSEMFDEDGFVRETLLKTQPGFLDDPISQVSQVNNFFLTIVRDPNGNYTQKITDIFGRTLRTWAHSGGTAQPIVARYTYDVLGNLLTETPPSDGATVLLDPTQYQYNTLGQLVWKKTPDAGETRYGYDEAGRIVFTVTSKDAPGFMASYPNKLWNDDSLLHLQYDDLGRIVSTGKSAFSFHDGQYYLAGTLRIVLQQFYDDIHKVQYLAEKYDGFTSQIPLIENTKGRLVGSFAWDETGNNVVGDVFGYDDEGRVSLKLKCIPGLPLQKYTYAYDVQGRILEEAYYNGIHAQPRQIKKPSYNNDGQLSGVTGTFNNGVNYSNIATRQLMSFQYDDFGRLNQRDFGATGTVAQQYKYDMQNRLTSTTATRGAYESFFEHLWYDTAGQFNGNIGRAEVKYLNGTNHMIYDYSYDDVNRLTSVSTLTATNSFYLGSKQRQDLEETVTYNNIGLITTKKLGGAGTNTYQYFSDNSNRLKRVAGKHALDNYRYDVAGNMIVDRSKKMVVTYDWRNLPVKFSFYQEIPVSIFASATATISLNDLKLSLGSSKPISSVYMLYDAGGNRVYKGTAY